MSIKTQHIDLSERGIIQVRCSDCGWSNDGNLVLVDRYVTDFPPIPRGSGTQFLELYLDSSCDPDDRVRQCRTCEADLDYDSVVERPLIPQGHIGTKLERVQRIIDMTYDLRAELLSEGAGPGGETLLTAGHWCGASIRALMGARLAVQTHETYQQWLIEANPNTIINDPKET